ncbi:Carboxylic ester hydrolase [Gryllus bimaculatus]|nr:Carboxylic ester hydrolase [Gryllus bimaculatus]
MGDTVTLETPQGKLRGRRTTSKSGKPLLSFLSVPYARPPVGVLRFKPPQKLEPWSGTRDALEPAPVCPQENVMNGEIIGQEDCLYLHVYTPQLPSAGAVLKPVMVWIHGGGFTNGTGNPDMYGPEYLVDADIVLVAINYRVGILGFLSLDNESAPGNMGLKDQVAALHWVKENIAAFGGDPNNVTIFGESAGGASVHYLMLSPLTKGLFHKVIAQSGCALNPWAFSLTNKERAFKLGEALGCKTADPNVLLKFLMKEDALNLIRVSRNLFPSSECIRTLQFPFVPTIEPKSTDAFLTEHPMAVLRSRRFHKVPLMIGVTSHEGMVTLKDLQDKHLQDYNSKFGAQLPESLSHESSSVPLSTVASGIKHFYFNDKPISKNNLSQFTDFQSDLHFVEGVYATVKLTIAVSIAPVYLYKFNFDGSLGFGKQFVGVEMEGACHGDDLGYLFRIPLVNIDIDPSSLEMNTINRMVLLWTNFAKFGNPTPTLNESIPVYWQPCSIRNFRCLNIDKEITLKEFPELKRMKFWEDMYRSKL